MKIILLFFILIAVDLTGQEKITVSTNPSETFIETYETFLSDQLVLKAAYRLGPASTKILKDGLTTALKWIALNEDHQKTFEKEICRFKAMEKELYKFHGYVDQFSVEMTLLFKGYPGGVFELEIKTYDGFSVFILFEEKEQVEKFKGMLNGKSANKEIDDIFKK